jgi:hypothetical protein
MPPIPYDVTISWDDAILGAQEGVRRFIRARERNRPTGDGRFDADQSTMEWDICGATGECAFAQVRGVVWRPLDRPDRYNGNHDVDGFEVKATLYGTEPHLIVPRPADPLTPYVLLSGWLREWRIHGWGFGMDLFDARHLRWSKGAEAYWIPEHCLDSWPPPLDTPFLDVTGLQP